MGFLDTFLASKPTLSGRKGLALINFSSDSITCMESVHNAHQKSGCCSSRSSVPQERLVTHLINFGNVWKHQLPETRREDLLLEIRSGGLLLEIHLEGLLLEIHPEGLLLGVRLEGLLVEIQPKG